MMTSTIKAKTHRIGWDEIGDLGKVWRIMHLAKAVGRYDSVVEDMGLTHAKDLLERVLDDIDPRWRAV